MRIHDAIIYILLFFACIIELSAKEQLFWEGKNLSCQALEDEQGRVLSCRCYRYNQAGRVIQETLFGNLSGTCEIPVVLAPDGTPESKGIESYSIYYEYEPEDPGLLLRQTEDNGATTIFGYDPLTKRCTSKRTCGGNQVLERHFFHYNETGFLYRTVTDDGQGESEADPQESSPARS